MQGNPREQDGILSMRGLLQKSDKKVALGPPVEPTDNRTPIQKALAQRLMADSGDSAERFIQSFKSSLLKEK